MASSRCDRTLTGCTLPLQTYCCNCQVKKCWFPFIRKVLTLGITAVHTPDPAYVPPQVVQKDVFGKGAMQTAFTPGVAQGFNTGVQGYGTQPQPSSMVMMQGQQAPQQVATQQQQQYQQQYQPTSQQYQQPPQFTQQTQYAQGSQAVQTTYSTAQQQQQVPQSIAPVAPVAPMTSGR